MIGAILGSSLVGAASASSAANKQAKAAKNDIAFQRETRDLMREDVAPFLNAGTTAQDAYLFNLGLGERPMIGANADGTGGTPYAGFTATPGYQFAFDQGTSAVNALAGARGGMVSGRTMQDLTTFGQGIANQEFGNYLNRLAGLTDQGLSAATMQANAANAAAGRISNAYGAIGNAGAAGAIGVGNAINGGVQNYLAWQGYQAGQQPQWQPTTTAPTVRPMPRPF